MKRSSMPGMLIAMPPAGAARARETSLAGR